MGYFLTIRGGDQCGAEWPARAAYNTALIRQAQESARERGEKFARVDTFSFRARPFYLKMGFEEVLTPESYPRTHERIYFRKTL